ncbi:MAG: hypothetical protein HQM00_11735 [Magnetococcales bacterium]|nr:hypothetical protein [Magnetococcales bacterium]
MDTIINFLDGPMAFFWLAILFMIVTPVVILVCLRHIRRKRNARPRFDDLVTAPLGDDIRCLHPDYHQ